MKLCSFSSSGRRSWGLLEGDEVIDVGETLAGRFGTLKDWLVEEDHAAVSGAAARSASLPVSGVEFLPVVPDPGKILCVGHNYESHRKETARAKVEHPSIFIRFADTLIGHGAAIERPGASTMLDFEGEIAVIIGKGGRDIRREDALAHIAGYSCFNDASLRDWQWHTTQFAPGKNFPGTGAFGPSMTTRDSVALDEVAIETRLNGAVVQSAPASDMIFPIDEIIAYVSVFTALSPGDVICTGTPGGVGAKREPPLWMKPGDTVEVDIAGLGCLRNPVGAQA